MILDRGIRPLLGPAAKVVFGNHRAFKPFVNAIIESGRLVGALVSSAQRHRQALGTSASTKFFEVTQSRRYLCASEVPTPGWTQSIILGNGRFGWTKLTIQPLGDTLNRVGPVAVVNQIVVAVSKALSFLLLGRNCAHKASKSALANPRRSDGIFVARQHDYRHFHRTRCGTRPGPQLESFVKECPRKSRSNPVPREPPIKIKFWIVGESGLFSRNQTNFEEQSAWLERAQLPDAEAHNRRGINHGDSRRVQDDPGGTDLAGALAEHKHRNQRSHALAVKEQRNPSMASLNPFYKFGEVSLPQSTIIDVPFRMLSCRGKVTVLSTDAGRIRKDATPREIFSQWPHVAGRPIPPGYPTMTARADPIAGPHVRYISCRPSEVLQLGGPSLQSAGPNRRTTRACCGAQETKRITSNASAGIPLHRLRQRASPGVLRRTSGFTILTPVGYLPLDESIVKTTSSNADAPF